MTKGAMEPDFWGIFHDGKIITAVGVVPGAVSLRIRIPYLRRMFSGEGDGFVVTLDACSAISYQSFDESATSVLSEMALARPEILYLQDFSSTIIDCAGGTLRMKYHAATVALDSGEWVDYVQLVKACENYWDAWENRSNRS